MDLKPFITVLALIAVSLAGCADGGDAAPDDAPPGRFDDIVVTADTGVIRGIVVDTTITPVTDVTVRIQGTERSTTTDVEGAFVFDRLDPGSYFLQVDKPGFLPVQQSVDVQAGVRDPPIVRILMERDPTTTPYVMEYKWDGFIECSFSLLLVRFAACGLMPEGISNEHFLEEYEFDAGVQWIQSEMMWESTQALGEEMQLSYTDTSTGVQVRIAAESGRSPVVVKINQTVAEEFRLGEGNVPWIRVFNEAVEETQVVPFDEVQDAYNQTAPQPVKDVLGEECIRWPALFDACMGMGGVGATLQQDFTVFTHSFHYHVPEEGWQFSVDGAPPSRV